MKKSLAATAIAATALGGAAAGATLFTPVIAGAQDAPEAPADADTLAAPESGRLTEALQGLVDDGTINESQRDAVVTALQEYRAENGGPRGHGHGHGPRGGGVIAETLGLEPTELRDALESGQSLADVAAAQGVSTDAIVDALVDQAEERVNDALEAGRIDEDQASEILAQAEDRAEALVNGEIQPGERGFGRRGPGGPGAGPDADGVDTDTAA